MCYDWKLYFKISSVDDMFPDKKQNPPLFQA